MEEKESSLVLRREDPGYDDVDLSIMSCHSLKQETLWRNVHNIVSQINESFVFVLTLEFLHVALIKEIVRNEHSWASQTKVVLLRILGYSPPLTLENHLQIYPFLQVKPHLGISVIHLPHRLQSCLPLGTEKFVLSEVTLNSEIWSWTRCWLLEQETQKKPNNISKYHTYPPLKPRSEVQSELGWSNRGKWSLPF